jgi:ABC-type Fe3+-hydroxamate transport system substrate-binding protein/adenosylcobinamide amidohydrolase
LVIHSASPSPKSLPASPPLGGKLAGSLLLPFLIFLTFIFFLFSYPLHAQTTPTRIISLSPFITESLYLLGVQDKIVGSTIYDRTPGSKNRTKVGSLLEINMEKIIALKPDIILATDLTPIQQIHALRKHGFKVEVFSFWKNLNTMLSEFERLGRIVGKKEKAEEIVEKVKTEINQLRKKINGLPKPKVIVEIGINPLWVAPRNSFINDYITLAGGINVGPEKTGLISREEVLHLNPDVIIITDMGFAAEKEKEKWLSYSTLQAARTKHIYIINSDDLCSPTPPRFVKTLKLLIKLLHPETGDGGHASMKLKNISLPEEVKATAMVLSKNSQTLFWEKTLIIKFPEKRRALSTMEGFLDIWLAVNHSASPDLWKKVCKEKRKGNTPGGLIYMKEIKEKLAQKYKIKSEEIAMVATAANMDNLAVVTKRFQTKEINLVVTALVTAGAKSNALRTGVDSGWYLDGKKLDKHGTVNIILLTNVRLTDGAMARAIITATEAKTAAFQDLKVPSSYTPEVIATGTGTDNIIIVSGTENPVVSYTGGHSKIGELIGKAVYQGVLTALCKQNGFCERKN